MEGLKGFDADVLSSPICWRWERKEAPTVTVPVLTPLMLAAMSAAMKKR